MTAAAPITIWLLLVELVVEVAAVVGTAVSSLKSSSSTRVAPEDEEEMFGLVV